MNYYTLLSAIAIFTSATLSAQKDPVNEEKKEIIIEKKQGSKKESVKIEINGDQITINGKPADEYTGKDQIIIDEEIVISGNKVVIPRKNKTTTIKTTSPSQAFLGVMTDKDDKGLKIISVTKESGAEKSGLKEGDIITMVNSTSVMTPEQLSLEIRKHKPGETVEITYLRNGKTQKVKATLGKTSETFTFKSDDFNFDFDGGEPYTFTMPKIPPMPRGFEWKNQDGITVFGYPSPKYGMSLQDDDEGRGVKVTGVDTDSNAEKAGLKKDDLITEVDGEKIAGVDGLKEKLASRKDNITVSFKIVRDGKTETISVKVPRKLKTANL